MSDITLFAHMDTAVRAVGIAALMCFIAVIMLEQAANVRTRLKHGRSGQADCDRPSGHKP